MQTYRRRKIHEICDSIWSDYKLAPGFDLFGLLSSLSINYREESLSNEISAVLVIKGDKKLITANSNHSESRRRFSISHELGHLFLAHKKNFDISGQDKIFFRDKLSSLGIDNDEIEANYFAACLLMPENILRNHINPDLSFDDNVESLHSIFKVSPASLTLRLNFLGYC